MKLLRQFKKSVLANYQLLITSFFLLITRANIAFAAGLIPDCDPVGPKGAPGTCNLCHILELGKNVITIMLELGVALAALFFAWGAFAIMVAGGSEEKYKKGKEIMTTAIYGIAIAFAAWLIVATLLQVLTGSPSKLPWNEIKCTI